MKIEKEDILSNQKNLSQELVDYLKAQILDGDLNPGDRIVETKLAQELEISHTPVREAVRQLLGEGVLITESNKGTSVAPLTMKDAFEIYSLRAVLEGFAIRLATTNATGEDIKALETFLSQMEEKVDDNSVKSLMPDSTRIHLWIIELADHKHLQNTYDSIFFQVSVINRILGKEVTKAREVTQHRELIEALKVGDPDHAEKVMRDHIYRSYLEFLEIDNNKGLIEKNFWD